MSRINYQNCKHHRELLREQIDSKVIDKIEISHNPSSNYKNAFKNIYQDELEKTLEEHQERKVKEQASIYHAQPNINRVSMHHPAANMSPAVNHSHSVSRIKKPFHDFDEDKANKYNTFLEKTLNQGSTFFREQDAYQNKKRLELQANQFILQQQLNQKEMQKQAKQQQCEKENMEVRENRLRQMENEMAMREQGKLMQNDLRVEIKRQMED